jgi:tubulin polyglutamylase TTLL1
MNLEEIKKILKKRERHDNGNLKTYIIQSYLERPFLYQRRKFDIRHFIMISSI